MTYEYHFYAPGEWTEPKTLLRTEAPLPGIAVGHRLYVHDAVVPIPDGHHLLITGVEVVISGSDAHTQRVLTNVFSKVVERATLQG